MKIGRYVIQWGALKENVKFYIQNNPTRVPFVVNTSGFVPYGASEPTWYHVESDGDKWFAHDNKFINLVESDASWGDSPVEALMNLMHDKEQSR